ncbi:Kinesin-like protein KIN-4A [Eumeta japonica]|uniref:Kinesin-like protein KIN-4A n=1 Tax=Eumeta variegata TaxID=151549 RepID=A0A4C1VUC9_EUMVA|nr:Kinesin-like protein KIN-4A [Eumeta japonica]
MTQVAVRVRPLRKDEGPQIVHVVNDKMLVLEEEADSKRDVLRQRRLMDKHYVYDRVFGEDSTQARHCVHTFAYGSVGVVIECCFRLLYRAIALSIMNPAIVSVSIPIPDVKGQTSRRPIKWSPSHMDPQSHQCIVGLSEGNRISNAGDRDEVYEYVCAPLVGGALRGYAGAVFAYGATGAGKTYTMTGLMSRALNHLFTGIGETDQPDAYEVAWIGFLNFGMKTGFSVENFTSDNIVTA